MPLKWVNPSTFTLEEGVVSVLFVGLLGPLLGTYSQHLFSLVTIISNLQDFSLCVYVSYVTSERALVYKTSDQKFKGGNLVTT